MKTRRDLALFVGAIAITLVAVLLLTMPATPPVEAAPNALVTPISVTPGKGGSLLGFYAGSARTADGNSPQVTILTGEKMDVQTVIDQGTTNTVTLKLQFSNDGTNWTDGQTVVTANAADATAMGQYYVYGAYARLNVDVTNANAVTITANGVLR